MTNPTFDPHGIYIRLPNHAYDTGRGHTIIAQEVVDVLRGKICATLHNAILRELLLQECNGSALRAGMKVSELIDKLS